MSKVKAALTCTPALILALFMSLILPGGSAVASGSPGDAAFIDAVFDDFRNLCMVDQPAPETVEAINDRTRYPEYGKSEYPGELWLLDAQLKQRFGYNVTIRVDPKLERCQYALWPNADHLFADLVRLMDEREDFSLHREMDTPKSHLRVYRSDRWEGDQFYRQLEVVKNREDEDHGVVIGAFIKERRKTTDWHEDPGASWHVDTTEKPVLDGSVSVNVSSAKAQVKTHTLEVATFGETTTLTFTPLFYPFASLDAEGKPVRSFYARQKGLTVDGKPLPAYEACVATSENCAMGDFAFELVLDAPSEALLSQGKTLTLITETRLGETIEVSFPLTGAAEAIQRQRLANLNNGFTPLLAAVWKGDIERARELLALGASPSKEIFPGTTPLTIACDKGKLEMIELLANYGANVNACMIDNLPALSFCASIGDVETLAFFLKLGTDPNIRDAKGNTALVSAKTKEVVDMLLSHGTQLNARNNEGDTALTKAARYTSSDITYLYRKLALIDWLLEAGARTSVENNSGMSGDDYLRESCTKELVMVDESSSRMGFGREEKMESYPSLRRYCRQH